MSPDAGPTPGGSGRNKAEVRGFARLRQVLAETVPDARLTEEEARLGDRVRRIVEAVDGFSKSRGRK